MEYDSEQIMYAWARADTNKVLGDTNSRAFAERTAERLSGKPFFDGHTVDMKVLQMPGEKEVAYFKAK